MTAPNPITQKNARKCPLPDWYLPKGTINASDSQLESASSSCERWGLWFAGIVVVSVIAELVIAWAQPPYLLFLTESAFADAAVAIGIAGEIALGTIWNNHVQTELRKRSDERVTAATNRAARAEAALLEFRRSRRSIMTAENKARLAERLSVFARVEFDTAYGSGGEQMHFLWDLEEALHAANWHQLDWHMLVGNSLFRARTQRPLCGVVDAENVEIQLQPEWRAQNIGAVEGLIAALGEIGIAAAEAPLITANGNIHAIHILIGPKA